MDWVLKQYWCLGFIPVLVDNPGSVSHTLICLYHNVPRAAASQAVQNCHPSSLLFLHPMIIHFFED